MMLLEWTFVYTHFSLSQTFFVTKRKALGLIVFLSLFCLVSNQILTWFLFPLQRVAHIFLTLSSELYLFESSTQSSPVDNCLYTGEFLLYFNVNTI